MKGIGKIICVGIISICVALIGLCINDIVNTYNNPKYLEKENSIALIDRSCNGFIVAQDIVLTDRHCIRKNQTTYAIEFEYGNIISGTVEYVSRVYDLALIKVKTNDRKIFNIATHRPKKDKHYFVRGYPGGVEFIITIELLYSGYIKRYDVYSGVAIRGYSGSPILDKNYEVQGVLVMGEMIYTPLAVGAVIQTNTFFATYVEPAEAINIFILEYNLWKLNTDTLNIERLPGEKKENLPPSSTRKTVEEKKGL